MKPIVTIPDAMLRRPSDVVSDFADVPSILTDMAKAMTIYRGVGLAAVQIGVPARIILVMQDVRTKQALALVNPVIMWRSEETDVAYESCLSIPGVSKRVQRHTSIVVEYQTSEGETRKKGAEGFFARVLQHEIDHLDGVLLTDRMTPGERHAIQSADAKRARKMEKRSRMALAG